MILNEKEIFFFFGFFDFSVHQNCGCIHPYHGCIHPRPKLSKKKSPKITKKRSVSKFRGLNFFRKKSEIEKNLQNMLKSSMKIILILSDKKKYLRKILKNQTSQPGC